jgi:hypothetical protein
MHKAFVACLAFISKDNNILLHLFRDSRHDLYDELFGIDIEAPNAPTDFSTTISDAIEVA